MLIDFISTNHNSTSRDYIARVTEHDKAECAAIAKQFAFDYWDGERQYGYGGYRYDGRWRSVADQMAAHYQLHSGDKVLDVGCGKAFLLYELTQSVPGLIPAGVDISKYALANAKEDVKPFLVEALAQQLPFADASFDFVFSLTTLHNLHIFNLKNARGVGVGVWGMGLYRGLGFYLFCVTCVQALDNPNVYKIVLMI